MPACLKFKYHRWFKDFAWNGPAAFMFERALGKSCCEAFFAGKGISFQLFHTSVTPSGCNFKISQVLALGLKAENFVRFHGHGSSLTRALW